MIDEERCETLLPGVRVPRTLVADVEAFGGRAEADCLVGDLLFQAGRAVALLPGVLPAQRMVLPRLADPHVHLDKCHTVDRMNDVGGDLLAAIAAQSTDKARWTEQDLRTRAMRGFTELHAAGCAAVRSHVDWSGGTDGSAVPLSWEVLGEMAADSAITLQRAALTGIDQMADPAYARACATRVARDGGVLGAFVFDQPERDKGLANMFREADRLGLALDFHVDEGLTSELDGLERIANLALATKFAGPILCGHACSLTNLHESALGRIADKLRRADIAVVALPQTNLYLQARCAGTPDRRGLTRIKELRGANVTVALGADNVRDAFCPIGRHDPIHVLSLAVLAAHLDPPLADHLPLITTAARRAMGLSPITVDGARPRDLLVAETGTTSDLLCGAQLLPLTEILKARI